MMKRLTTAAMFALVPVLGGCVIIDADEHDGFDVNIDNGSAGTVYGAEILPDRVTFRVTSNGCTSREDFEVDVDEHNNNRFAIEIDRVEPDRCRALLREGTQISWTLAELGIPEGADVYIENPVRRR